MFWFGDPYKLGYCQQIKHEFTFAFTVLNRVTTVYLNPACRPLSSKIGGIIVVIFRNTEYLPSVVQKLLLIEIEQNWQKL